jgi:hypothetical protein
MSAILSSDLTKNRRNWFRLGDCPKKFAERPSNPDYWEQETEPIPQGFGLPCPSSFWLPKLGAGGPIRMYSKSGNAAESASALGQKLQSAAQEAIETLRRKSARGPSAPSLGDWNKSQSRRGAACRTLPAFISRKLGEGDRTDAFDTLDLLRKFLAFVTGLEIRVFDKAIVYCVDIRVAAVALYFIRPADTRTSTDSDAQRPPGLLCLRVTLVLETIFAV